MTRSGGFGKGTGNRVSADGSTQGTGRWLATPANAAQAQLREALDQAAAREADEVALRRVWARLADLPDVMAADADRMADRDAMANENERARRVRWPWIVAASLAGATATLAFMLIETKSEMWGSREGRGGGASQSQVTTPTKREFTDQRSALVAPATVRTGFGETLQLALRGGTDVVVTSESVLILDENDRPAVSAGEVRFHVPPQAPGRDFAVTAGPYRVVVVGTRFRVRVNAGNAAVGVDEGMVEIWTNRRIARLGPGESWTSPVQAASTAAAPSSASGAEARRPTGPDATTKAAKDGRRLGVVGSSRHVVGSKATGGRRLGRSSQGSLALATASKSSGRAAAGAASKEAGALVALASPFKGTAPAPAPAPVGAALVTAPAASTAADVRVAAEAPAPSLSGPVPVDATPLAIQARAARAAGDSRRALGLYRTLAQKGGAAGENAEYEIGRVLRDGLHQPQEAVAVWRGYRAQHPRGLLRIESDLSVIETLIAMGDKSGAVTEASDFIRRYPDSERRVEVARLTGDLLRERGDCSGAIRAYDVALGSGRARRDAGRDVMDGASFHRSLCLLRTDPNDGISAMQSYLQSFPGGRFRAEAQRLLNNAKAPALSAPRP